MNTYLLVSQRLSSITTRIKTKDRVVHYEILFFVRDYLPLQQGLRLCPTLFCVNSSSVRDYLPLQQGLRLPFVTICLALSFCQRLSSITTRIKTKPSTTVSLSSYSSQRLSSITTRIKTFSTQVELHKPL